MPEIQSQLSPAILPAARLWQDGRTPSSGKDVVEYAAFWGIKVELKPDGCNLQVTGDGVRHGNATVDLIRNYKASIVLYLRECEIAAKVQSWREWCTAERGYDWTYSDWRTAYQLEQVTHAQEFYAQGCGTVEAVHAEFVKLANLHRRCNTALLGGKPEKILVTQSGHFGADEADVQFARFGLTVEDAANLYLKGGLG